MTDVTVTPIAGPDGVNFIYLLGEVAGAPAVSTVRTVAAAALASGATTVAAEVAALRAEVEAAHTNWQAATAALANLQ